MNENENVKKDNGKRGNNVVITEEEMNNRIDLYDIKQDILKVMIVKSVNNKLPKEDNKKILKYIERKLEQNKSPNSVDNRIYSLYKTIKKQVDDYLVFCEIE